MTPTETTTILRQFNKWLRGNKDGPQLESREIGEAIDAAVEMIESAEEDRAHRIATLAAEDFVRCNGTPTNTPDQFVLHGEDVADELCQDYIAHLKWVGGCITFDGDGDDELVVLLGDFTLGSLA